MSATASDPRPPRRVRKKPRRRVSVIGIFGELLITAGLLVLGYIAWQPLWSATVIASHQRDVATDLSEEWRAAAPTPTATPESEEDYAELSANPPVTSAPEPFATFGNLYVPAFGDGYVVPIGETTNLAEVLNDPDRGIGHYETTQLPGEVGNFAIAAHRSGPVGGNPFREIMELRVGDPIYVETADGWYTYRFRSFEYVWPQEVDVLDPVPRLGGVPGVDRILTLTTCHPKWAGWDERAIGYAVYEGFRPIGDPPPDLVAVNPSVAG